MHPFTAQSRQTLLPVLTSLLLTSFRLHALPTAVNDSYSGSEDTPLTVAGGGTLLSASWDAGADGFTRTLTARANPLSAIETGQGTA